MSMFVKEFVVISDDIQKIKEFVLKIEEYLSEICKVEKIGAAYLCAPDTFSLVTIYIERPDIRVSLSENIDLRNINIRVRIESEKPSSIINIASRLNKKVKELGLHMTILTAFKI